MRLKVLHCIPSIDPSYGGPVTVARGLCKYLSDKAGLEVCVLTTTSGSAEKDRDSSVGFGTNNFIWSKPWLPRFYWEPFLTQKNTAYFRTFDLVHVHGVFNGLSSSACRAAKAAGIPYILVPFGTLSPYCLKKNALIKKAALFLGEKRLIEGASAIQFSSSSEKERMTPYFRVGKSFEVPNGIDWDLFRSLPPRGHHTETLWTFLGRLQPIKGLEPFIRAFVPWSQVQKEKHRFIIIGPDEAGHRAHLEQVVRELKAEACVQFVGALYGRDRVQALLDSDIFVLPSHHENFGIAAAEAMACRRPVWISEYADLSAIVRSENAGVVSNLSAPGITSSLDEIMRRRAEWPAMGERGHAWVSQNCQWEKIGEKVLEAYQWLISS